MDAAGDRAVAIADGPAGSFGRDRGRGSPVASVCRRRAPRSAPAPQRLHPASSFVRSHRSHGNLHRVVVVRAVASPAKAVATVRLAFAVVIIGTHRSSPIAGCRSAHRLQAASRCLMHGKVGGFVAVRRIADAAIEDAGGDDDHRLGIADDDHRRAQAAPRQPLVEDPLARRQLVRFALPFQKQRIAVDLDDAVDVAEVDAAGEALGEDLDLRPSLQVEASASQAVPTQRVVAVRRASSDEPEAAEGGAEPVEARRRSRRRPAPGLARRSRRWR